MTEDEAKTKWCPHAIASHTDPRAQTQYERPELGLPTNTYLHACIASECMAWRRISFHNPDNEGFCGLAGAPQ